MGTRKAEMPFLPASGFVTAKTMAMRPVAAQVMNCFVPATTQPEPSRRARVRRLAASDPAWGSVSAKAPVHAPEATSRRTPASIPRWSAACTSSA